MPRLSNIQRERAIGMLNTGTSVTDVARVMGCSRRLSMIFGHVSNKLAPQQTDLVRVDHVWRHMQKTDKSSYVICVIDFSLQRFTRNELFRGRVTAQTIRNRLRTARLHARRPYHGPILTQLHRRQRFLWAQRHLRWTQRDWNRVVFSDESRFTLHFADGRVRVWRRRGETPSVVDRFGGGRVMVWVPVHSWLMVVQGHLTATGYRDQVLIPELLPFMAAHGPWRCVAVVNAHGGHTRYWHAFIKL